MNRKADYRIHAAFLGALFLIGNSIIFLPIKSADDKTFLGFILGFIISLALIFPTRFFVGKIMELNPHSEKPFKKYTALFFFSLIIILVLIEAVRTFLQFTHFAATAILPKSSSILIGIIFAAVIFYLCIHKSSVVLKFSLFGFIPVILAVTVFFIMSFSQFRWDNIFLLQFPSAKELLSQTVPYLLKVFLPFVIVLIYENAEFKRAARWQTLFGFSLGSITLALTLLNTLLLFGSQFASTLDFPYASAISTVTVGYLFSRMDGFSYFIYFACALIKTAVCISVIKVLIGRIKS